MKAPNSSSLAPGAPPEGIAGISALACEATSHTNSLYFSKSQDIPELT